MTSLSSASVRPLSFALIRWPDSCSVLPPVINAATVIKLRSRLESSARSHTSPNRTSSVSDTIFGKKSPIICCAGVCPCDSDMFFLLPDIEGAVKDSCTHRLLSPFFSSYPQQRRTSCEGKGSGNTSRHASTELAAHSSGTSTATSSLG